MTARRGAAGRLLEASGRGEPRPAADGEQTDGAGRPVVGVLVLAAGLATRMRGQNKLTAELGGRALVARVVDAVAEAGLPPPVVVTGAAADEIARTLSGRTARLVHAADHALGLAHSLAAGIAAAPDGWDAVIVCLGDMPYVDGPLLARLAAACRCAQDIVVPLAGGRRGNPLLWGRAHFGRLRSLTGDVGGKALLGELDPCVRELSVEGSAVLVDIDTPEELAAERLRLAGGGNPRAVDRA